MTSPCIPELQCDRFLPPKECCFKTIPPHQGWLLLLLAKRAFRIRWGKIKTKKKPPKQEKKKSLQISSVSSAFNGKRNEEKRENNKKTQQKGEGEMKDGGSS